MDAIRLAVALVRKIERGQIFWLARLNPSTRTLKFVVGHWSENESLRETITREVAWELDLDRRRDFLVSNMAQLNIDFPNSVPAVAGQDPLSVSFYNVEIYRRGICQRLTEDPQNFWLTSEEIWGGAHSAYRVDTLLHQLITQSQVIRSWESSIDLSR